MSIQLGTLRHDIFEVQTGLKHSGYDPGPLDGFWGPRTFDAATAFIAGGSKTGSRWAITEMGEGLRDLGWLSDDPLIASAEVVREALINLTAAYGAPRAAYEPDYASDPLVSKTKPALASISEGRVIEQAGNVVTLLVLHTSATSGTWWRGKTVEQMRDEFDRWHRAKGWNGVGYHGVYAPDGSSAPGRPYEQQGAHVSGHNEGSIGFCMVPIRTIDKMGHWSTYYTPEQVAAVRRDLHKLAERTPIARLAGHNEFSNKLCPGFVVEDKEWTELAVA
jgi:hypothetical protein